jgi:uncharacterized peroxidase-related enzyme
MSWIESIPPEAARGALAAVYDRAKGRGGRVDNILKAQGLRPPSLAAHFDLYRAALHDEANTLPRTLAEAVGVYVSMLNGCEYCARHHFAGLRRLLKDDARAAAIHAALEASAPAEAFTGSDLAAMRYARALTVDPGDMRREAIIELRREGFDDGAILELNQVVAYFNYANRVVSGLGVTMEGEEPGRSPGDGAD